MDRHAPPRRPAQPARRRVRRVDRQVRPAGLRPPVRRRDHPGDGGRAAAGHRDATTPSRSRRRAGWPGGGSRAGSAARPPARASTAPSSSPSRSAGWACSTPSGRRTGTTPASSGAATACSWPTAPASAASSTSSTTDAPDDARHRERADRRQMPPIGASHAAHSSSGMPSSSKRLRSVSITSIGRPACRAATCLAVLGPDVARVEVGPPHHLPLLRATCRRATPERRRRRGGPSRRASTRALHADRAHGQQQRRRVRAPARPAEQLAHLVGEAAGDRQPDEALVVLGDRGARRVRVGLEHDLGGRRSQPTGTPRGGRPACGASSAGRGRRRGTGPAASGRAPRRGSAARRRTSR